MTVLAGLGYYGAKANWDDDGNVRNQEKNCLRISNVFAQLCLFLNWLRFLQFLPKFYRLIVSNYRRATVVISQNDAHVPTTT